MNVLRPTSLGVAPTPGDGVVADDETDDGALPSIAHLREVHDLVNITWDTNSGPAISAPGDDHQQGILDKERAMPRTSLALPTMSVNLFR